MTQNNYLQPKEIMKKSAKEITVRFGHKCHSLVNKCHSLSALKNVSTLMQDPCNFVCYNRYKHRLSFLSWRLWKFKVTFLPLVLEKPWHGTLLPKMFSERHLAENFAISVFVLMRKGSYTSPYVRGLDRNDDPWLALQPVQLSGGAGKEKQEANYTSSVV